eukprot:CAMPEP_0204270592 /NCGR_PEP_ID=MMETSP0468-20130131/18984_1 /ASSEMBLY_ACC=CAM_ASM_000383 /TAXON_ID=2969 /ORGANISM="Oxyrrhis marina" /LENGTH=77 /DNA_ID=CAMNT_0051246145 /DNA_START=93 /DNA_END=322 /DNA_ORIENTATION=-
MADALIVSARPGGTRARRKRASGGATASQALVEETRPASAMLASEISASVQLVTPFLHHALALGLAHSSGVSTISLL